MPCSRSSLPTASRVRPPRATALRHDRRGTTAIEFSLIALPLIALLMAVFEITTTFFAQQVLETAAERGARLLMTGTAQKSNMTAAEFKNKVCTFLPGFLKCSRLMIDVNIATDFSSGDTTVPSITLDSNGNPTNTWSYRPGNPGDIVVMKTMYVWNVQGGPLGFDISSITRSKRLLMSTSVFKAETY